ncbi:MAG: type IV pilus modification protein PilV [Candidatus Thiodiazotropha sp. (ex Monitilora ramsayi)]|nr:type IV pilus modification protein PilV [Candidatus Thiodiazotropha sp. (ex Monitilora ramsayi)]
MRSVAGFTLMEVLVTMVILSIGLLGVAGLQLGSLRGNQSAFHSSIAANLAVEGADRLRSNVPGVRNPNTGADRAEYDLINAAGADPGCIDTTCSYAELADHDAFEWITSIQNQLPSGQGAICRDGTPHDGSSSAAHACDGNPDANGNDIFAIKVWWDHDLDPATPLMAYRLSIIP